MLKFKVFTSKQETCTKISLKNIFGINTQVNLSKVREEVILTLTEVI